MKWKKLGLVFNPKGKFDWAVSHALQPTPLVLEDRIRAFVGLRDAQGVSRIGFVDVDRHDPGRVLGYSPTPILDIGEDGCFDENGVVPSAIVADGTRLYLFYAGYQLGKKVRFSVLGGLAVSDDGGVSFRRQQRVPVFERTDKETLFRVPHSVIVEDGLWRAWYGAGDHFVQGAAKTLPVYDIRYTESRSVTEFREDGRVVLPTTGTEYRLGRPYLFRRAPGRHYLFYGFSTEDEPYRLGYAVSDDLLTWRREDDRLGIVPSESGWDSEMLAYPAVVATGSKVVMLYNGRNYGEDGFGAAELVEW